MPHDILAKILKNKEKEVEQLLKSFPLPRLSDALSDSGFSVIAEIKRRSPSAGEIGRIQDPEALARQYLAGGASAISVLTDSYAFGGSLADLRNVATTFPTSPVLRKDFLLHPIQIQEAALVGASAVLLIVGVLQEKTAMMLQEAHRYGLEAFVEVHDSSELATAIESGARIIGVNNRNLRTFDVSLEVAEKLAPRFPDGVIKVALSGIHTLDDAARMHQAGYDGVLIGEVLVRSEDPAAMIRAIKEL